MQDYRITIVQIALLIAILLSYRHAGDQWTTFASWCVIGVVALVFVQRWVIRWRESKLLEMAHAEWSRERIELLEIELARGVTYTMACFIVDPVMDRRYPANAAAARVYLEMRRQQQSVPPIIDVQAVEVHR